MLKMGHLVPLERFRVGQRLPALGGYLPHVEPTGQGQCSTASTRPEAQDPGGEHLRPSRPRCRCGHHRDPRKLALTQHHPHRLAGVAPIDSPRSASASITATPRPDGGSATDRAGPETTAAIATAMRTPPSAATSRHRSRTVVEHGVRRQFRHRDGGVVDEFVSPHCRSVSTTKRRAPWAPLCRVTNRRVGASPTAKRLRRRWPHRVWRHDRLRCVGSIPSRAASGRTERGEGRLPTLRSRALHFERRVHVARIPVAPPPRRRRARLGRHRPLAVRVIRSGRRTP